MKIDTVFGDTHSPVVAYYDVGGDKHYLYIANANSSGVNVAKEGECTVVDGDETFMREFTNDYGAEMFVDSAALHDGLLDKLIEHDAGSVEEYFRRVMARANSTSAE